MKFEEKKLKRIQRHELKSYRCFNLHLLDNFYDN